MNEINATGGGTIQAAKTIIQLLMRLVAFAAGPTSGCATGQYGLVFFVGLPLSILATLVLLSDFEGTMLGLERPIRRWMILRSLAGVAGLLLLAARVKPFLI